MAERGSGELVVTLPSDKEILLERMEEIARSISSADAGTFTEAPA